MRAYDPGGIPRLAEVSLNGWVLSTTLAVGLLSGILPSLVPAIQAPYEALINAIRNGDRSIGGNRRQKRLRSALVGTEVALSLVLLVGAGLLIRSFVPGTADPPPPYPGCGIDPTADALPCEQSAAGCL